jgi:DNA-binding response OmpR family regulator
MIMKVLVVEQQPQLVLAIEGDQVRYPFTCERASDGWEAIEKLETSDYAAIVIDGDLPRHSGFGVLTYLREEIGEALDNVIVMTSSDEDTLRSRLRESHLRVVSKDKAADALNLVLASE